MTARLLEYTKPLAGIAALSLLAACSSDLTGGNMHSVQLSVTSKSGVSASTNGAAGDFVVGNAGSAGELTLTQVQLVFRKIELDRTGTEDCVAEIDDDRGDDDSEHGGGNSGPGSSNSGPGSENSGRGDDECEEIIRDPLLVNVPLNNTLSPVIEVPLPEGTFSELEAKLGPARERSVKFNTDNPNLVGKSVRVVFTLGSSPTELVFTSNVRAKVEMEFEDALVIDDITKNVTIDIDVRNWFVTSTGAVLDPTDPANRFRIEQNIRRSFHAFEDNHERGEDRHEGHN